MLKSFEVSNLYHQYLSSRVHSFLHEHSMQASVCVCELPLTFCFYFSLLFIWTFVNCFGAVVIISEIVICNSVVAYFNFFWLFHSHTVTESERTLFRGKWHEMKWTEMRREKKTVQKYKLYTFIYLLRLLIYRYYCSFVLVLPPPCRFYCWFTGIGQRGINQKWEWITNEKTTQQQQQKWEKIKSRFAFILSYLYHFYDQLIRYRYGSTLA